MTTKQKTPSSAELQHRQQCDDVLKSALARIHESGVPMHIMIDRLFTYAGFTACAYAGKENAAQQMRQMADTVEAGLFDGLDEKKGHA